MRQVGAAMALVCACSVPETSYRDVLVEQAYLKAMNPSKAGAFGDEVGASVALSADGTTLAVGAPGEDGSARLINGADNDQMEDSGAVYVFVRTGSVWLQEAYIKPTDTESGDRFGSSVALSADGSVLVVGAPNESSNPENPLATRDTDGIDDSGAAYVFVREAALWQQQAFLKAPEPGDNDQLGSSVAISADATSIAVGARLEDGGSTGIDLAVNEDRRDAGAVFTFIPAGTSWMMGNYVKPLDTAESSYFGSAVALSADGTHLVVGASHANDEKGAAYVFEREDPSWRQQARLAQAAPMNRRFGEALAISDDARVIAIGANQEDSSLQFPTTGGAVLVFERDGETVDTWALRARFLADNQNIGDLFGSAISMTADGTRLLVGAWGEASAATGVGAPQTDNSASNAGAAYVFERLGESWKQAVYLKASHMAAHDNLGQGVAISSDGVTLVVGAPGEDGVAEDSGAAYVFR